MNLRSLLLPAFILFAAALTAQTASDLAGVIIDPTGSAIPCAYISLKSGEGVVVAETESDVAGRFQFTGIQPGAFRIEVRRDGFDILKQDIRFSGAQATPLELRLTPAVVRQSITVFEDSGYAVATSSSATKLDTPLRDLPQAVQVIPEQILKQQVALSMQDALRNVSGVSAHMGEGRRDQVYIRGFSALNDQYVDGVRDDAPYYRDLSNIDRIEVVKGPGSVLSGRGASGGIINRATKRPNPEQPIVEFGVTVGSYGAKRVTGDLGDAYLDGKLAWRLTGAGEDGGSHRDRYYLNRYSFAPSLAWTPRQGTQFLFQAEHLDDQRLPDRGISALDGRPAPVRVGAYYGYEDDFLRNRVTSEGLTFSHQFSDSLSLTNTFRHLGYSNAYSNTYPNGTRITAGVPQVLRGQYNVSQAQQNYYNQTDFAARRRFLGMTHHLLAGAEFGDQNRRNIQFTGSAATVNLFDPILTRPIYSTIPANNRLFDAGTAGVYVQDQIDLSLRWKLLVGLRRDRFTQRLTDLSPAAANLSRTDNVLSPRAGIVYQPSLWTSFYASASRSSQPSGDGLTLASNNAQLQPETTVNYEIGNKSDLLRGRLQATVSLFDLSRNNVKTVDPVDFNRLILAGKQRTRGAEVSLAGDILPRWSVYGGYALLDSRIVEANDLSAGVPIQGNRLGHIPRHSANLWSTVSLVKGLTLGTGLTYNAGRFTANDNLVVMPAYVRLDAALLWRSRHYEASLNLRNLTNTRYFETAHGTYTIMPGAPINGLLTLRYRW